MDKNYYGTLQTKYLLSPNRIRQKARSAKDYLLDWFNINLYDFWGPYPVLVGLYILNIVDLFYHPIGETVISQPSIVYFVSAPFILLSLVNMTLKLKRKWPEINERYRRKRALTKSLGLTSFVALEFIAVVLGLTFGLLGFLQSYLMHRWDVRLELILYGFFVPNLLSIMGRGYIGESLIARKLRLYERIARHSHSIGILAGLGFLITGLVLIAPTVIEKEKPLLAEDFAYARSSSINPARHELTLISTLPNNRIIITEQFGYTKPGKYLFVYIFPYTIRSNLPVPDELNNDRIIDLKYENFSEAQSSIVWILWNSTSIDNPRFGIGGIHLGFEIDGAIYENDRGHYSLTLPLATTPKRVVLTNEFFDMMQDYQAGWIWDPLNLQLVIDGKATNIAYNPQVEKEGLFHKSEALNNRELLWTIPNEQTVSVRYDILEEIRIYERGIFFAGIFIGVGIPTLMSSVFDYAKWRRTDFMRSSGVTRIKHYIFSAWFTLLGMRVSFQENRQTRLDERVATANKLYNENKNIIEKWLERIDNELIVIQPLLDPNFKPRIEYYTKEIDHLLNDFARAVEQQREQEWDRKLNQLYENIQSFMEEPD